MPHDVPISEIENWLIHKALADPDILKMFESLCIRIRSAGIPLDRATVTWPTLHPLFQAELLRWDRDAGAQLFQYQITGVAEGWRRSPFHFALTNGIDLLRRRLVGPEAMIDFEVLEEFRDAGFTDYLMTSTEFRIAHVDATSRGDTGIMASWVTKRDGGFSDADMEALTRIQRLFAVACRASIQQRVMDSLAEAFLGRTGADRVLSGNIRLGDGERIQAVVWFSDLRGSSFLSYRMAPDSYLSMLRKYYACTAQSVIDEGGEVLDFIGDGVLGIFPVRGETTEADAIAAATRAMERAMEAGVEAERVRPSDMPEISFSVIMAVGDVMFGNVGVESRLVFTAIGEVVNVVTRIDDITKKVGSSVLVTEEVAAADPEYWVDVGAHQMAGMDICKTLYAPRAETGRFDNTALVERMQAQLAAE